MGILTLWAFHPGGYRVQLQLTLWYPDTSLSLFKGPFVNSVSAKAVPGTCDRLISLDVTRLNKDKLWHFLLDSTGRSWTLLTKFSLTEKPRQLSFLLASLNSS